MWCTSWFGRAKSRVRPATGSNNANENTPVAAVDECSERGGAVINIASNANGGATSNVGHVSSNRPASALMPLEEAALLKHSAGSSTNATPAYVLRAVRSLGSSQRSSGAIGGGRGTYTGNAHLGGSSAGMTDSVYLNNLFTSKMPTPQLTFEQASIVIDMVPVPMCIIDSTGSIRYLNLAFRNAVWFDVGKERAAMNILDVICIEDADKFYSAVRKLNSETLDHILNDCSGDYLTKLRVDGECRRAKYNWTLGSEGDKKLIIVTGRYYDPLELYIVDDSLC